MTTGSTFTCLYVKRASAPLSADDAVAWFAAGCAAGRDIIGYTLSAREAAWIRVRADGTAEHVSDTDDPLADSYEMVLFDGDREMRWLRTDNRCGPAVALGEDPAALPPGHDVTADPPPQRGATRTRLLAGKPVPHDRLEWTILTSERYAAAYLPLRFTDGQLIVIDTVEYLAEDSHGNLDPADTRTLGLRATTREAVSPANTGTGRTRT